MNYTTYYYIVDLDERGTYKSHVEHSLTGEVIFEITNEDTESGQIPLIEDGFMKNTRDMDGLNKILVDLGIILTGAKIVYKG
jgi:hypothetical protein